ncbi:hypothetical protein IMZ38_03885 [Thermosphaera chiliense]|uniref:Uncharacterized protein n=1 Tax=Thermosphaera chiliense TaxID=3402707 RepID=A0A7M1UNM5_9CREN|nr:hypothetical protein [Thermosphaera aggregans]QOR93801.1 hypothetical protein IMZ38_03885 [Thermosphaera aggregans]
MLEAQTALNKIWPCDCWFCRLFTRRILSHYVKSAYVYRVEPRVIPGGETELSQELDIGKELKDLKNAVSELRSAVAEIKAVLADLTGPYSYYKPKEEVEPTQHRAEQVAVTPAGVGGAPGPSAEPGRAEKPVEKQLKPSGKGFEELVDILSEAGRVVREEREAFTSISLKQTINLMKMIYEVRKLYPKASVERILDLMEQLRIVSKEEASILRTTINIVEQSLEENITPEENTLLMYMLLKNLGIREEGVEDEVMRTVLKTLALQRTKSQHAVEAEENKSEKHPRRARKEESPQGVSDKWENQQQ